MFVLLAGVAAYFASRRRTPAEMSRFLVTRGLWLIFLELTVLHLAWVFDPQWKHVYLQVIWAIGFSMVVLAVMIRVPRPAALLFAGLTIVGHNALDGESADSFGEWAWLWSLLHEQRVLDAVSGHAIDVYYPAWPWAGVMVLGWLSGPILARWTSIPNRSPALWVVGGAALACFTALRASNWYGDPVRWATQDSFAQTAMSFLNVSKYPPSLLFLMATFGIGALLLAAMLRWRAPEDHLLVVIGRIPLFYYVLHLYLIHLLALMAIGIRDGSVSVAYNAFTHGGVGWSLPAVYAVWLLVLSLLYLPCRWFAGVKARRRDWWLSYL